jgi:hypothetical protein
MNIIYRCHTASEYQYRYHTASEYQYRYGSFKSQTIRILDTTENLRQQSTFKSCN